MSWTICNSYNCFGPDRWAECPRTPLRSWRQRCPSGELLLRWVCRPSRGQPQPYPAPAKGSAAQAARHRQQVVVPRAVHQGNSIIRRECLKQGVICPQHQAAGEDALTPEILMATRDCAARIHAKSVQTKEPTRFRHL